MKAPLPERIAAQTEDRIGCRLDEIDTPALIVDLAALERNIERMAAFGRQNGISIRPHAKAHKSPIIAQMQIDAGAIGVCCQKVGEAAVLHDAGVRGLLIANEAVGPAKMRQIARIAAETPIVVAIDNIVAAQSLSEAAVRVGSTVGVIVDVDVGQERCGVAPGQPALDLAVAASGLKGLRLTGLQGYQGKLQHIAGYEARAAAARDANARLMETRSLFERAGLPLEIVTGGGTGTYDTEGLIEGMTELQTGSYIFMDRHYRGIGGRTQPVYDDFEPSLSVISTVMSTPTPDRVVLDAGIKALSTDSGPPEVLDLPGWDYVPGGDEHGILRRTGETPRPALGDVVRIRPSHCDTTVNLYDAYHVIRDNRLQEVWPIPGRGRLR